MSLIEVKGLKKSFGSLQVLRGIDLTVEQNERIAIIGGSGCGKSVFLRSLCLLETPDEGQVFIDGREITAKGAKVDEIRRNMGMVFQKFHLFSEMDVMDNLCLAPTHLLKMSREDAEKKAMDLLYQVGLSSRAHVWPTELSGGQPIGFNTAMITEIAKRLNMNVELVNVSCPARGIALATGVCDIVFWMEVGDFENWEGAGLEDQPENTVVTAPYLSVPLWWAVLKDSPVVNVYRDGQTP